MQDRGFKQRHFAVRLVPGEHGKDGLPAVTLGLSEIFGSGQTAKMRP
jgi:hypothetical protein